MDLIPLAPRARWLFHLQALFQLALVGPPVVIGIVVGLSFVTDFIWAVGAALAVGLLGTLFSLWLPTLAFAAWGYRLGEDDLLIQQGVILRRLTAIPASRIQHVDTYQGPLDRIFGLARVHVYTASGSGADGVIPGLLLAEATRLRDRLIRVGEDDAV